MKGRKLLMKKNMLKERINDETLENSVITKDLYKCEFSVTKY